MEEYESFYADVREASTSKNIITLEITVDHKIAKVLKLKKGSKVKCLIKKVNK